MMKPFNSPWMRISPSFTEQQMNKTMKTESGVLPHKSSKDGLGKSTYFHMHQQVIEKIAPSGHVEKW